MSALIARMAAKPVGKSSTFMLGNSAPRKRRPNEGKMRTASLTCLILLFTSIAMAAPCKAPKLKQGMQYKVARRIAISAGFQAPALPAYGYSEKDPKVISECDGDVQLCNKYPEIDSCGSGNCAMEFSDAYGNTLRIITYGELFDGSAEVTNFEMKCSK